MFWSQFDEQTNLELLRQVGFTVQWSRRATRWDTLRTSSCSRYEIDFRRIWSQRRWSAGPWTTSLRSSFMLARLPV
jgi:hypothetical protein